MFQLVNSQFRYY